MLTVEAQIKTIFSKGKPKNLSHTLTSEKEFQPGAQAQTSEVSKNQKKILQSETKTMQSRVNPQQYMYQNGNSR